jgi:Icc-related predicted phosphoesterase
VGIASAALGCQPYRAPSFADLPAELPAERHFTVVGDLQSTMKIEAWRESNDPERRRMVPRIMDAAPAFVVMVGDLVSWGGSAESWKEFDFNSQRLRDAHVPVLAVPGNHDYWGDRELRHYFAHFEGIAGRRWYDRRYGPLAMIFLDSNADEIDPRGWTAQQQWFQEELAALETDATVSGVLVFLHHAPFTNSSVVGDDPNVTLTFVPAFTAKKKTMAMITGHAHGYERFERQQKTFLVAAGGGGPRSPLLPHGKRRHEDDKFDGPPLRHLNFVEFTVTREGLSAEVLALPKGAVEVCRMDEFTIAWPEGVPLPSATSSRRSSHRPSLRDCCPKPHISGPHTAREPKSRPATGQ